MVTTRSSAVLYTALVIVLVLCALCPFCSCNSAEAMPFVETSVNHCVLTGLETVSGTSQTSTDRVKTSKGPAVVFTGIPQSFTVSARDSNGKPVNHGGNVWIARFVGPSLEVPNKIVDEGNGNYTFWYKLPLPGLYKLELVLQFQMIDLYPSCSEDKVKEQFMVCNTNATWTWGGIHGFDGCENSILSPECEKVVSDYTTCMYGVMDRCNLPRMVHDVYG